MFLRGTVKLCFNELGHTVEILLKKLALYHVQFCHCAVCSDENSYIIQFPNQGYVKIGLFRDFYTY